jgi:hypothetical protein
MFLQIALANHRFDSSFLESTFVEAGDGRLYRTPQGRCGFSHNQRDYMGISRATQSDVDASFVARQKSRLVDLGTSESLPL